MSYQSRAKVLPLFSLGPNTAKKMHRPKSILLVEDDELDVISVQRSVNKFNLDIQLETAFSGVEALAALQGTQREKFHPDIILLDLNMPKMNGIEFLKEMRKDPSLSAIKVFVMTTSNEESERKEAEKLGVSGYLIKPMNLNENTKHRSSMDAFMQFHILNILRK